MGKNLSPEEVTRMKQMVIQGKTPEDIAKHFKCAVSTVHYHKGKFKKEGIDFKSVRGQRPKGVGETTPGNQNSNNLNLLNNSKTIEQTGSGINLTVNGVPITISSSAKGVIVSKDQIKIDF